MASIVNVVWFLWLNRNNVHFQNAGASADFIKQNVLTAVAISGNFSKGTMLPNINEFNLLNSLMVKGHPKKQIHIKQVLWIAPSPGWIKVNTDGAAHGSPGVAASGGLFRDSRGQF